MGFLVAPGRSKNRPEIADFRGYKNSWFSPKNSFRFTGPFHMAIVGGTPFSLRSIGTFRSKEFGLHHFWCKLSP